MGLEVTRRLSPTADTYSLISRLGSSFCKVQDGVGNANTLEKRDIGTIIQAHHTALLQEELVGFKRIFGCVIGIGNNENHLPMIAHVLERPFEEGNVEIPLFVQSFV